MTSTSAPIAPSRSAGGRPSPWGPDDDHGDSGLHHSTDPRRARAAYPAAVRAGYAVAGLAALTATVVTASHAGGWAVTAAIVFGIAPDLALLAGVSRGIERGRLHPRAVPAYNAAHRLVGPVVLLAVAVATRLLGGPLGAAALAWLSHVLVDRACGYGLRAKDGWQRAGRR